MAQELHAHEAQKCSKDLMHLAEAFGDVFWIADARAARLLYISPSCETVWGYSSKELYERPGLLEAALRPDAHRHFSFLFVRPGGPNTNRVDEVKILHRDGAERWIRVRRSLLCGESGTVGRIVGIAEDVTLERDAKEQMNEDREALCSLAMELVLAEEKERQLLAADLHDGLTQILYSAQLRLEQLRHRLAEEQHIDLLDSIAQLQGQGIEAARSITFQLSPPVLHDFGLEAALKWLSTDLHSRFGLELIILGRLSGRKLDERVSAMLYRSIRELAINVVKHSGVLTAEVRLQWMGARARIDVIDSGRGFSPSRERERKVGPGFGLAGIRQRLEHIGGVLEIESSSGAGTTASIYTPAMLTAKLPKVLQGASS